MSFHHVLSWSDYDDPAQRTKVWQRLCGAWTSHRKYLSSQFAELLKPIDNMLASSPFLLSDRPLFVDYNLYGVIGNYLFNGKTKLPSLKHLRRWHRTMKKSN